MKNYCSECVTSQKKNDKKYFWIISFLNKGTSINAKARRIMDTIKWAKKVDYNQ